jgi:hypothetical protein
MQRSEPPRKSAAPAPLTRPGPSVTVGVPIDASVCASRDVASRNADSELSPSSAPSRGDAARSAFQDAADCAARRTRASAPAEKEARLSP